LGHTVAHRILQTWTSLHYLNFDSERKVYRAGLKLLWTGMQVPRPFDNPDLDARLRQVFKTLALTSNVGVLDGPLVLHVARNEGRYGPFKRRDRLRAARARHVARPGVACVRVRGQRHARYADHDLTAYTPSTITSLPLLLADLREIRQKKFAFSFGMIDSASATLAVPLRDSDGRVVAAMNVVGPMTEFGTDAIRDRILPALTDIAAPPVVLPALISGRQSYRKEHLA